MSTLPTDLDNPHRVLITARVIWAALLMGLGTFSAVLAVLIRTGAESSPQNPAPDVTALFYAGLGMGFLVIPLGLFIRGQIFKAGWVGDVVKPRNYLTGNIMAWACCEGVAFFGLAVCLIARSFWPYAIVPAAAITLMISLWPNGRAMFPRRP